MTRLRETWAGPVGYCVRVYLGFRLALLALGLLVSGVLPHVGDVGAPGWPAPPPRGWSTAVTAWETGDALWYLRIAADGYALDDGSGAFFPLYPLLIRLLGALTGGQLLLAAYVVSNVALIVALVLLYRLTALELSEPAARRAVLLMCAFPTGFFLFAPYTESLFLALAIGALHAARTRRWAWVVPLGLAAGLCRSPGVLLAAPLAVEALLQARAATAGRWRVLAMGVGAALAPVAGLLVYLGYWQRQGDWRRPLDLQRTGWQKEPAWPWETLEGGVRLALQSPGTPPGGYFLADLLVVALVLAAGVWVALRMRATYAVHVWVGVIVPLLLMWPGRPLLSLPRIYLVLFPVVWALVRLGERFRAHDAVLLVSAGLMTLLAALFASSNPFF